MEFSKTWTTTKVLNMAWGSQQVMTLIERNPVHRTSSSASTSTHQGIAIPQSESRTEVHMKARPYQFHFVCTKHLVEAPLKCFPWTPLVTHMNPLTSSLLCPLVCYNVGQSESHLQAGLFVLWEVKGCQVPVHSPLSPLLGLDEKGSYISFAEHQALIT